MKYRMKRHAVSQPLTKSYRLIPLTQGQNAIVDAADFEWASRFNWCALWSPRTKSFYAVRGAWINGRTHMRQMHRELLRCKAREKGDHRNHDTLDNRRSNLRVCTSLSNAWNQKKRSTNTSGYKGVTWIEDRRKWRAQICVKGKHRFLGEFDLIQDAVEAYDEGAREHFGEFAHCNVESSTS